MSTKNYIKNGHKTRNAIIKYSVIIGLSSLALYFIISLIFGEMGLVKYYRMKSQHAALAHDIAKLKLENLKLMKDVRALRSDPAYIERLARDKLGLARPGEIVYYYGEP